MFDFNLIAGLSWAREHIQNYDMFLFAMNTEDKEGIERIVRYSREKNRTAYFKMKHGKAYFCAPKIYGDEYCASMGKSMKLQIFEKFILRTSAWGDFVRIRFRSKKY